MNRVKKVCTLLLLLIAAPSFALTVYYTTVFAASETPPVWPENDAKKYLFAAIIFVASGIAIVFLSPPRRTK